MIQSKKKRRKGDNKKIIRVQFTRWDKEHYPQFNNKEYLDSKWIYPEDQNNIEIVSHGFFEENEDGTYARIKKPLKV